MKAFLSATSSLILVLIGVLLFSGCGGQSAATHSDGYVAGSDEYVVILSMDGCRWDYPALAEMPNLESIGDRLHGYV